MKVSIITASYNAEKTIEKTFKSVRDCKNSHIEYIVVDAKSSDNTPQLIERNMDIIDILISEKDDGIYDAINKGIRSSSGEYTLFLAADDILIPNAIENFLSSVNSETDIWSGSIIYHNQYGFFIEESDKDLEKLKYECSLRHPASFFRKESFLKYGYYDPSLKCSGDREIFLRFYLKGAKFQIEKIPIEIFNDGGISTKDPLDLPVKEGLIIENKYGLHRTDCQNSIRNSKYKQFLKNSIIGRILLRIYYTDLVYRIISGLNNHSKIKLTKNEIYNMMG